MPSTPPHGVRISDRRKVLLALGFGAVNVLVLRRLPSVPTLGRAASAMTPPVLPDAVPPRPGRPHALVVAGGRVIDPASGYDRVANVGIDDGKVTAIDTGPLRGRDTIEAVGRVVAPGFIDILSYDPNPYGIWFKVADGVTCNLGMHGIDGVSSDWLAFWERAGSPCHFGGAFDEPFARAEVGLDPDEAASPQQIAELVERADQGLRDGWLGVDFEPEYTPGVEYREILAVAQVAARYAVPCFFHGRYSDEQPPGTNADTLGEVLRVAREARVGVHVQHITSTGGTFSMQRSLATLQQARAEGIDVTACAYPYDYWAAFLGSPRFSDGWQERFRIGYDDLEIPGSGERLTSATFEEHRRRNTLAVAHAIPGGDLRAALRSELVMVASDGILEPGNNNHPRGAGTFARTLGRYVREERTITLRQALAKMTILPARRLERAAPAMARKGRLQIGSDADIVVFDPDTVGDKATVGRPAQESEGIDWVLVSGEAVKDPDGLRRAVKPGRAIRRGAP